MNFHRITFSANISPLTTTIKMAQMFKVVAINLSHVAIKRTNIQAIMEWRWAAIKESIQRCNLWTSMLVSLTVATIIAGNNRTDQLVANLQRIVPLHSLTTMSIKLKLHSQALLTLSNLRKTYLLRWVLQEPHLLQFLKSPSLSLRYNQWRRLWKKCLRVTWFRRPSHRYTTTILDSRRRNLLLKMWRHSLKKKNLSRFSNQIKKWN